MYRTTQLTPVRATALACLLLLAGAGFFGQKAEATLNPPADVTWYTIQANPSEDIKNVFDQFKASHTTPYDPVTHTTPGLRVEFAPGNYSSTANRVYTNYPVLLVGDSRDTTTLNATIFNGYTVSYSENPFMGVENLTWRPGPFYNETGDFNATGYLRNCNLVESLVFLDTSYEHDIDGNSFYNTNPNLPAIDTTSSLTKSLKDSPVPTINFTNNIVHSPIAIRSGAMVNAGFGADGNNEFICQTVLVDLQGTSSEGSYLQGNTFLVGGTKRAGLKSAANYSAITDEAVIKAQFIESARKDLVDVSNPLPYSPSGLTDFDGDGYSDVAEGALVIQGVDYSADTNNDGIADWKQKSVNPYHHLPTQEEIAEMLGADSPDDLPVAGAMGLLTCAGALAGLALARRRRGKGRRDA